MTITEAIAHRIMDGHEANQEAVALGLFAAECELWANGPGVTPTERREILDRAEKYQALQIVALARTLN